MMAEVAGKGHPFDPAIVLMDVPDEAPGTVPAAIIHHDDFIILAGLT